VELFATAIDHIMPQPSRTATESEDVLDVLWMHRQQRQQKQTQAIPNQNQGQQKQFEDSFPQELRRR
jgi:hypothetical protein